MRFQQIKLRSWTAIVEAFLVHMTARNPYHFTIELPEPPTDSDVELFNRLVGRSRP